MKTLGIDIGGTNIKYGVIQCELQIRNYKLKFKNSVKTEASKDKEFIIKKIISIIEKCKNDYDINSIGIGVAGLVDYKKGIIFESPNLPDWKDINLKNELKVVNLPIFIDNDANCFAYGEYLLRNDKTIRNLIGITLGTGIGGGLIINGKLYHGNYGFAAEIGHIKVVPDGRRCNCGQNGCLEAYSSGFAIEKKSKEIFGEKIAVSSLYKMALKDNRNAIEIFNEAFEKLGIVCAGLINLLNPDIIVFGGGLSNMREFLLIPVKKVIQKNCYKKLYEKVRIEVSQSDIDSGIIGAAYLLHSNK
ncbi:MAG: ROK family protein [Candidatus Cloacimonadota bacterium]|nr:ROK family protein [Candidatus Cloacimonadota bacterium]